MVFSFSVYGYFLLSCSIIKVLGFTDSRIVNGTNADIEEFPYAVSLRYNSRHTCGGTILNEKFILTAAHCACNNDKPRDAKAYSIQYGLTEITTDSIQTRNVKKINCNEFDSDKIINDCAVIEQNDPISRKLQKLEVEIYDDETCAQKMDNKHHICFGAMNGGACNGDSGTALLVDNKQVGIASFITNKCGIANKKNPNVYSRIPTYYKWINDIMAGENSITESSEEEGLLDRFFLDIRH
ncbi:trypsin 3A1-like isoform X2 [Anthonomus grandis grandis]|uniref:trypsin 3A1-like isoform X2 n=1 Tax=Anthonomus grandis grandis TaxID=2921223 RepID=UPI0021652794|nr:trypsin 3A1-like isoform X2 [Anthonomus grandis grandis]